MLSLIFILSLFQVAHAQACPEWCGVKQMCNQVGFEECSNCPMCRRMSSEEQAAAENQDAGEGRSLSFWHNLLVDVGMPHQLDVDCNQQGGHTNCTIGRQLSAENQVQDAGEGRSLDTIDYVTSASADFRQLSDDVSPIGMNPIGMNLVARRLKATEESRNLYGGDWGTVPEPIDRQLSMFDPIIEPIDHIHV